MKKLLHYSIVTVMLAVVCTGCESHHEPDIMHPDNGDNPKIDPPVNELLRKEFEDKFIHDGKYIRKAPEYIEYDTTTLDTKE